ncbi:MULTISPECIES: YbaB/EbfC family nucleoid-associated protein [unclassified Nocardioides]|uniref:YbaB/EbfC family nucleoid-associated protein n=1 Tax=unclassified Nocardioides TaxID=2615069 RepID=UPI0010546B25|nr:MULTISPECIES: YbaB/EbfC family nucleoid-associated protein [unclassified Nocardioides]
MDRIARARDGLDRAAQPFERAAARRETVTAADTSGQVTVRMAADGTIEDILVERGWTARLDPEELGSAVLEAFSNAGLTGAQEWGRAVAEAASEPAPPTRPLPSTHDSVYAQLSEVASPEALAGRSEASLRAMVEILSAVRADLDRVSAEAEALGARRLVGEAQGARVTLTGTGALIGADVDPDWAATTDPANLGARLMGAYRDARRQARERAVDDLVAESSIGELQRLTADPHALADRLRLT